MANATPEMPRHIETAYKDAVDNMLFSKRQQWVTTNYAILAYAAIFVVSGYFFSRNDMGARTARSAYATYVFVSFVHAEAAPRCNYILRVSASMDLQDLLYRRGADGLELFA
jgi:hypothetical protein